MTSTSAGKLSTRHARPPVVQSITPLVTDTTIAGETKADGVIPAHPGGAALRVSKDKWLVYFATLDTRGWDANRSILYQLRGDAPDGPVITEGCIERCRDDWQPLEVGTKLFKSCGMPIAFGVPKGAIINRAPAPSANRFVIKWYRWAHLPRDTRLLHPHHHSSDWPQGLATRDRTLRIEWMQFRLREDETDIEIITPPAMLRQRGYEEGEAFCELGPNYFTNHAMVPASPMNAQHTQWLDCHTFVPYADGSVEHGSIATVQFTFNAQLDRYEWTHTGVPIRQPGRLLGEASVVRQGNRWLIAARSFSSDGSTAWFATDDPFAPMPQPIFTPSGQTPRTVFRAADDAVWVFGNAPLANHDRSRLCAWRLDEKRMKLSKPIVIADASAMRLPMHCPMLDMPKLCPSGPGRSEQLLLFRAITRRQTADQDLDHAISEAEHQQAGIYAASIAFNNTSDPWQFDTRTGDAK